MIRRTFLSFGLIALVAACAAQTALSPDVASSLYVAKVDVNVSAIGSRTSGRDVSSAQLRTQLSNQIRALVNGQPRGSRTAEVRVWIDRANFVGSAQSLLVGGVSTIAGTVSVVDFNTGEEILAPTRVAGTGGGYAPGGVIGALARPGVEDDIGNTVNSFAGNVKITLFGGDA